MRRERMRRVKKMRSMKKKIDFLEKQFERLSRTEEGYSHYKELQKEAMR